MALYIDTSAWRLVDTSTGQCWSRDEITDTDGLSGAALALRWAGDPYHRITRGEALIFAGHSQLGVRLRDADEARERVSTTLGTMQSALTEETFDGAVYRCGTHSFFGVKFRPPATPELLEWLLNQLDEAEAVVAAVWGDALPIFEEARQ